MTRPDRFFVVGDEGRVRDTDDESGALFREIQTADPHLDAETLAERGVYALKHEDGSIVLVTCRSGVTLTPRPAYGKDVGIISNAVDTNRMG